MRAPRRHRGTGQTSLVNSGVRRMSAFAPRQTLLATDRRLVATMHRRAPDTGGDRSCRCAHWWLVRVDARNTMLPTTSRLASPDSVTLASCPLRPHTAMCSARSYRRRTNPHSRGNDGRAAAEAAAKPDSGLHMGEADAEGPGLRDWFDNLEVPASDEGRCLRHSHARSVDPHRARVAGYRATTLRARTRSHRHRLRGRSGEPAVTGCCPVRRRVGAGRSDDSWSGGPPKGRRPHRPGYAGGLPSGAMAREIGVLLRSRYPRENHFMDDERVNLPSGSWWPGLGVWPFASSNSPSRRPPQVPGGARSRQGNHRAGSGPKAREPQNRRKIGASLRARVRSAHRVAHRPAKTADMVRLRPTARLLCAGGGAGRRVGTCHVTYFVPTMQRAMPGTRTLLSFSNTLTFAMTFARIRSRADRRPASAAAETRSLIISQLRGRSGHEFDVDVPPRQRRKPRALVQGTDTALRGGAPKHIRPVRIGPRHHRLVRDCLCGDRRPRVLLGADPHRRTTCSARFEYARESLAVALTTSGKNMYPKRTETLSKEAPPNGRSSALHTCVSILATPCAMARRVAMPSTCPVRGRSVHRSRESRDAQTRLTVPEAMSR